MVRSSTKLPSKKALLLNGGVLLVVAASMLWALKSSFFKPDVAACSERYPRALRIGLDRSGQPMQSSDLQAMVGGTDWNLLSNTRVVGLKAGPSPFALEFKTVVAHQPGREEDRKDGIGFVWTPQAVLNAKAACLSYAVFVPEDFDFGAGGRLPGLVAASKVEDRSKPEPVSTRITWNETGALELAVQTFQHTGMRSFGSDRQLTGLERGKWTIIEQEVVLNTPGATDGTVRVWRNGKLVIERTDVVLRKTSEPVISSVFSEVVARPKSATTAKPAAIWISPYELKW